MQRCKTYLEDIEKIKNNKYFTRKLIKYLNINIGKRKSHKNLIKYLEHFNEPLSQEELKKCRNDKDPITYEDLKNISAHKLVLINEHDGMYDCFNVVILRKFLFENKKEKYLNPLTMSKISDVDIDKILSVNIKCINYFC